MNWSRLLRALFAIKSSLCSLDQSHKLSGDCHSCYRLWLRWFEWYWTDNHWLQGTLMAVASVPSLWVRRVKEMLSFSNCSILNLKHVGTGGPWLGSNQVICRHIVFLLFCYLIWVFSNGEIHLDTPFSWFLSKPPTSTCSQPTFFQ